MSAPTDSRNPPPRRAKLVLVTPDGVVAGSLAPVAVATPWWQDAAPVVAAVRDRHGIDVTILRILETERAAFPGGLVTYLAEVAAPPAAAKPWPGELDDDPLRQPYARPGGPSADLAWADTILSARGLRAAGRPRQIRTWNLSSLWQIPLVGQTAWLKIVPPFFAHEGALLERLAAWPVPQLLGRDGARMLLEEIPGEDLHAARPYQLRQMLALLVDIQVSWRTRTDELLEVGAWDWRAAPLSKAIGSVYDRHLHTLADTDRRTLEPFIAGLPDRLKEAATCGLPDTLVHGDFHPGNVRGDGHRLTLLDWGDAGVGHPLLDCPSLIERIPGASVAAIRRYWLDLWQKSVPGSEPARAWDLLAPVGDARQAVVYQVFLDRIEPAEHGYHRQDPPMWLSRAATRLRGPALTA